jgi:hypothetical protein
MKEQPLEVNADGKTKRQTWEERRERTNTDEFRM